MVAINAILALHIYSILCKAILYMLKQMIRTCRYGCKYKGEGCFSVIRPPVAAHSDTYRASLIQCARTNKQETVVSQLVEAAVPETAVPETAVQHNREFLFRRLFSGNHTNSIPRTDGHDRLNE